MSDKAVVQRLREITGCSAKEANSFLWKNNNDLNAALDEALKRGFVNQSSSLAQIFDHYKETPDTIGIDGTIAYIQDLGLKLEDPVVLAVAMELESTKMGCFRREAFLRKWSLMYVSTLDDMKAEIKNFKNLMTHDNAYFTKVYKFTFGFNLNDGQRLLPVDIAAAYWKLLLADKFPLLDQWIKFVTEIYKRNISKDTWNMLYEFSKYLDSDPDLQTYNTEAAWPSVIDDFVDYIKR